MSLSAAVANVVGDGCGMTPAQPLWLLDMVFLSQCESLGTDLYLKSIRGHFFCSVIFKFFLKIITPNQ